MCSRVWFVTDRRISQEYPQLQILRALKERCADEDVEFRSLLMDQIVLTISEGQLGKYHTRSIVKKQNNVIKFCTISQDSCSHGPGAHCLGGNALP